MIRLRKTTNDRRVILVRIVKIRGDDLQLGGVALSAVIPLRWFGTIALFALIGWSAAYLVTP